MPTPSIPPITAAKAPSAMSTAVCPWVASGRLIAAVIARPIAAPITIQIAMPIQFCMRGFDP